VGRGQKGKKEKTVGKKANGLQTRWLGGRGKQRGRVGAVTKKNVKTKGEKKEEEKKKRLDGSQ